MARAARLFPFSFTSQLLGRTRAQKITTPSCASPRPGARHNIRILDREKNLTLGPTSSLPSGQPGLSNMADLNLELQQLADDDDFERWEKLVRSAASQEDGSLNRNSNPSAISTARDVYDKFLAKFPLVFGYFKQYADIEFNIAGSEAAEMVRRQYTHDAEIGTVSDVVTGLRARGRQHSHERRPMGKLRRLQAGNEP